MAQNAAALLGRRDRLCLGLGLLERDALDDPTLPVQAVELFGDGLALGFILAHQQARAQAGVADATAGVDPRADQKAEVEGRRRPIGLRDVEQRPQAWPGPGVHDRETLRHEGAVEPRQGNHIRDGRQRHEVECGQKVRRLAPLPTSRRAAAHGRGPPAA